MRPELEIVSKCLNYADKDPESCLDYWNNPNKKYGKFIETIRYAVSLIEKENDKDLYNQQILDKADGILDRLNNIYHENQNFCWRLHDVHFHVTLDDFIKCPFTCLTEVSEFIEKVNKNIIGS